LRERASGLVAVAASIGARIVPARHTPPVGVPSGWSEVDGALEREFAFPSFPDAIAFVDRVAVLAESENHHPDIAVQYRRVRLRWTTHSAGGVVTERDRQLAERSAELA
jgi:4a-hydroxytetrahydrobiopterin dehydratase